MYGIIIWLLLPLPIFAGTNSRLATDLLKNYVKLTRPYCGKPVTVYLDMGLRDIQDLNGQKQILQTNVWMRLVWYDCKLAWNASEYDGLENIYLPDENIWIPDLALYENTEHKLMGFDEYYRVQVNSSGFVTYNFPSQLYTSCSLDIRNFPFDIQVCQLSFGSWSYNDDQVTVTNVREIGDRENYLVNGEWKLESFDVKRITRTYLCCNEPYSMVRFEIKIRRKVAVYLMNLIFPSILISVVGLLGFVIPCESGERISISVTVLLALAVFHLVINDTLPHNSDSLPYLGYFFLANMLFVGLCCTMSIIILNIHHTNQENSCILQIMRYLKARRKGVSILDNKTYNVTKISADFKAGNEAHLKESYIEPNKKNMQQQSPQKADTAFYKESLPKELLEEIEKAFAEKRKSDELKAELANVEIYVNRIFMGIAIILYISLSLMLVKLSQ